jgi:hypothetical protein
MGYAIYQKRTSNKFYDDYKFSTDIEEIQVLYNKANNAQHNSFISTRIGIALWIADIAWVAYKGFQNKKVNSISSTSYNPCRLNFYYVDNILQIGYQISF